MWEFLFCGVTVASLCQPHLVTHSAVNADAAVQRSRDVGLVSPAESHLFIMSRSKRTVDSVKSLLQSCAGYDSQQTTKFYNSWAETYEQDLETLEFRSPFAAVDFLDANFAGNREEVQVLDVGCGTGLVAKLMFDLGFRNFVGVDGSKGMLEKAAETSFYQDLRLALLGSQPLPAQAGMFDVVITTGSLGAGFIPVSVVRELCHAAKPGGLVCMTKGNHTGTAEEKYHKDLERELQLMEEEGLWSLVAIKQIDRYMMNAHLNAERDGKGSQEDMYIGGRVYLYKTSINPADGTKSE